MRSFRLIVVTMFVVGALGACHPNNSANKTAQTNSGGQASSTMSGFQPMMGNRPRLRIVCANDIARLCQADNRVARCLRQNMQSLGADCRTAVEQVIALARQRRLERMNNGNTGNGSYGNGASGNYSNNPVNGGNGGRNNNNPANGGTTNGGNGGNPNNTNGSNGGGDGN